MTEAEFESRMSAMDKEFCTQGVPANNRFLFAWSSITNQRTLKPAPKDPLVGPYDGPNLYHSIVDWYTLRYPRQMIIGYGWGPRVILIRGEIFRADIPVYFNPEGLLDAFKYLRGLAPALRDLLDSDERGTIQKLYNRFLAQASELEQNLAYWSHSAGQRLIRDLIHKGLLDLKAACETFSASDPSAVLFTVQQGPEKYLKAMIAAHDPTLTDEDLRKRYGHSIARLLTACTQIDPLFSCFDARIQQLDYSADVRYRGQAFSVEQVTSIINLAHDVSHSVARHLLLLRTHH